MPLIDGVVVPLELPVKHKKVLSDRSKKWRYRALYGGRYGMKDWSITGFVTEMIVRVPKRILFTREVQKTIKASIYQLMVDTINRLGYREYFTILENEISAVNGSIVRFMGIKDLNAKDIKSLEKIDIAIVCEAQDWSEKSQTELAPTIRAKGSEIWYVYNPQAISDFIYKFTVLDPPKNMIAEHVNYLDCPAKWISEEILEEANRMKEENYELYRHVYLGEPVIGGCFFTEFGDHMREMPYMIEPHKCNLYGSIDYGDGQGENASATSFGFWHVDEDGRPHRLFTYYKKHQDAATYAREIVASIRSFSWTSGVMPKMTMADPSMFIKRRMEETYTKSVADIFADYGLPLTPANNDRVNGWRVVRGYFGKDETGVPRSFYWDAYNNEYEEFIPQLKPHSKNPDDCQKVGEDHVADDCRYGFVAFMGMASTKAKTLQASKKEVYSQRADIDAVLASMSIGDTGI
jgi:hypothetical protein